MKKKTLHIIPHSHWDREWYMSFDAHRIHLVELFDTLIDTMEKNPDYTYYHMDGQFIVIEDYLEIKPYMKDRLIKLIQDNRIQIGPWYVLQDEYLTSGEANVRNMLYGIKLCKSIGADPVMCGYFPDAFGNISQAPQILNGFGIEGAVFGRGLNDLGADNAVVKQNGIMKSELIWQSPDGSEVVGVMFANWYHNAMELPTDREALKKRIENIVQSTSRFANTDHLLGMNGCDHQPVQTNLHKAIKLANEVQDEVVVKQSNFKDYIREIIANKNQLASYQGEIAGQLTSGHYLLINTASSHVDIKQKNHEAQNLLERLAEPINALAYMNGSEYPHDFFLYAWRKLMQNHPHDSICSCSCDEIYKEMLVRFMKSTETAKQLEKSGIEYIASKVDTSSADKNIVVVSLEPQDIITVVNANIDYELDEKIDGISIYDHNGNLIPAVVRHIGRTFTYTLPKDRFRQPKYVNRFAVSMLVKLTTGIGYSVYTVKPEKKQYNRTLNFGKNYADNGLISIQFNENGSFNLTTKKNGKVFCNMNYFEDTLDQGNLYNYGPVQDDIAITTLDDIAEIDIFEATPYSVTFKVVNHPDRDEDITTYVTVKEQLARVDIKTTISNRTENHRVRALFESNLECDTVLAEGQFDLIRRNITPWENWTCPYNTQRCQAFITMDDTKNGLLAANKGLCEYEILRDGKNTMALTLLRCTGEIGDWGVFPTPLGQCIDTYTLEYAVVPYVVEDKNEAYSLGYTFASNAVEAIGTGRHKGELTSGSSVIKSDNGIIRMSALKKAELRNALIFRLFNISENTEKVTLTLDPKFKEAHLTNLNEDRLSDLKIEDGKITLDIPAKKIITIELA